MQRMRFKDQEPEDEPEPDGVEHNGMNEYIERLKEKFGVRANMLINFAIVAQSNIDTMALTFNLTPDEKVAITGLVSHMVAEMYMKDAQDEIDDMLGL